MDPQPNLLAFVLLLGLLVFWFLDFVAALLSLKSGSQPLPKEFAGVWDEPRYAKAQQYEVAQARFGVVTSLFWLTVLLVLWWSGALAGWHRWSLGVAEGEIGAGLLMVGGLFLGRWLLGLPFEAYSTFVLEERFGFNRTTWRTFVADGIKGLVLSALFGLPLLAALLWIFGNVEQAWLWAWGVFTVFSLGLTYLAPSLILPLFNEFKPLPEGELRSEIEKMAEKSAFPLTEISVMDGSRRSAKSNAFFTGLGKRKRIALFDNLIEQQSTEELVGVLAHEIGHFKKRHIVQRLVISLGQTALLFGLLGLILRADSGLGQQLFATFGVAPQEVTPAVALVLFLIAMKPLSRLLEMAMGALSRRHEFEADAFAADLQGAPEPLCSALKKLTAANLSNLHPHPLEVWLGHSHPPVLERIAALRAR